MKPLATPILILLAASLVLAGCASDDAGGPSPEERAAKMTSARDAMMKQGPTSTTAPTK